MKSATVYSRLGRFYVHASSRTTAGVWIATPPFIQVEAGATSSDLGRSVFQALSSSQSEVPHPTKWSSLMAPLLAHAGVKTWETFTRKSQCLTLEATENRIKLIPSRNLGATEGFEPMLDKAIEFSLSPSSLDQLGLVVERGLALCT